MTIIGILNDLYDNINKKIYILDTILINELHN